MKMLKIFLLMKLSSMCVCVYIYIYIFCQALNNYLNRKAVKEKLI